MTKTVQLQTFKIDDDLLDEMKVYVIDWPKRWSDLLKESKNPYKSFSFEQSLKTKIPTVIDVRPRQTDLFVVSLVPEFLEEIKALTHIWFRQFLQDKRDLAEEILRTPLAWREVSILDLRNQVEGFRQNWIPAYYAHQLSLAPFTLSVAKYDRKTRSVIETIEQPLDFRTLFYNTAYECMSVPIKTLKSGQYFSYVIQLDYIDKPYETGGYLKVGLGIRRFIQRAENMTNKLIYNRMGSVLIKRNQSIVEGVPSPYVTFKYKKKDGIKFQYYGAGFARHFKVDMEDIVKNPLAMIEREDVQVLLPYSSKVYQYVNQMMGPGIGLQERNGLFKHVSQVFESLELSPKLEKVNVKSGERVTKKTRLPLIHPDKSLKSLRIEVWAREPEAFIKTMLEYIVDGNDGLIYKDEDTYYLNFKDQILPLHFDLRNSRQITAEIEHGQKENSKYIETLKQMIGRKPVEETLALIEIGEKDKYKKGRDPKSHLRQAFIETGRLNQFIYPIDVAGFKSRIDNALGDLLSDAGFFPSRVNEDVKRQYKRFATLSLIYRKGGRFMPVIVYQADHDLSYQVFGASEAYDFQTILKQLSRDRLQTLSLNVEQKKESTEKTISFFNRHLKAFIAQAEEPTIVLVDQKLKRIVDAFSNAHFNLAACQETILENIASDKVYLVRVNHSYQVPEYLVHDSETEDYILSTKSGLFKSDDHVYYYAPQLAKTMQLYRRGLRLDTGWTPKKLDMRRLTEYVLANSLNDEEGKAIINHVTDLTHFNVNYDAETSLPYPFQRLKKLAAYANLFPGNSYAFFPNAERERLLLEEALKIEE